MMKNYHFISGLPRSGSTLLCNILAQNPRFHATSTSGIMDVMFGVRNQWDNLIEFKASPDEAAKKRVLKGIFESFHEATDKPVVFDKCRGWLSLLEMADEILGERIKVLVPVRDIRDVLASFEKLWRETSKISQMSQEAPNYFKFQTVQGRCEVWSQADQPIGLAFNRIKDAIQRGHSDRMHFVKFDDLTSAPKSTIEKIYNFLGEEYYEHNFDNVEQVTWENDEIHGIRGLHDIRKKVEPVPSQWQKILGSWALNMDQII